MPYPFKDNFYGKRKRKEQDDNAVHGVQFHKQFPKDFLRPYGKAVLESTATDADLQQKLKPYLCEWLNRPAVAISEALDTFEANDYALRKLVKLLHKPDLLDDYNQHPHGIKKRLIFPPLPNAQFHVFRPFHFFQPF